jgi:hypothetical protein
MEWQQVFELLGRTVASRLELMSAGATGHDLTVAVSSRRLVRIRRDHYALPATERPIQEAIRIGGRLGCVSALSHYGVFAFDTTFAHLHLGRDASRLRAPRNRFASLTEQNRDGAELHWSPLLEPDGGTDVAIGLKDALAQSLRCQHPWHAIASLDNALNQRLIDEADLAEIFASAPLRCHRLRAQLDGRSEAGQESVLRLIILAAGLHCDLQVVVARVGRVDLIVEGILALEADSRLAHDGWALHVRDRDRDLELARQGYMSLRPVYHRTMSTPNDVRDAVLNLLAAWNHHRVVLL